MSKPRLDLAAIFPEFERISNADLRQKVDQLWQRLWQESKFERLEDVPVSSKVPRSHLPHAQAVVRLAVAAADVAEQLHKRPVDRDLLIAAAIAQDAGKLVELANVRDLFCEPLHPYTQLLIASLPSLDGKDDLHGIAGSPPSLLNPPSGCPFHPRCPYVLERCKVTMPPLREHRPGHFAACYLYEPS